MAWTNRDKANRKTLQITSRHTFLLPSSEMQIDRLSQNEKTTLFAAIDTSIGPSPYCSAVKPKLIILIAQQALVIWPLTNSANGHTISASIAAFCLSNSSWIFCFFNFCISFSLCFSRLLISALAPLSSSCSRNWPEKQCYRKITMWRRRLRLAWNQFKQSHTYEHSVWYNLCYVLTYYGQTFLIFQS